VIPICQCFNNGRGDNDHKKEVPQEEIDACTWIQDKYYPPHVYDKFNVAERGKHYQLKQAHVRVDKAAGTFPTRNNQSTTKKLQQRVEKLETRLLKSKAKEDSDVSTRIFGYIQYISRNDKDPICILWVLATMEF